jgi:hypothetical protein
MELAVEGGGVIKDQYVSSVGEEAIGSVVDVCMR